MGFWAWFLNASHATFLTWRRGAEGPKTIYQFNCGERLLQAGWKQWRIWTEAFFLKQYHLNGIEQMLEVNGCLMKFQ